ncbi:MAG: flotillin-like FloA family protein, partial [Desulfobacterales bacterium]|nr:flotillin-like FloA family protein [Desulfobacterales bacterium]
MDMKEILSIVMIVVSILAGLVVFVSIAVFLAFFKLWLRAFVTRARIGPFSLLFMWLRKVSPTAIVDAKI